MRRRHKSSGKAAKAQHRGTLKRPNTVKVARQRKPSAVDATERIAQLTRERDEAVEQQTATAEIMTGHEQFAHRYPAGVRRRSAERLEALSGCHRQHRIEGR